MCLFTLLCMCVFAQKAFLFAQCEQTILKHLAYLWNSCSLCESYSVLITSAGFWLAALWMRQPVQSVRSRTRTSHIAG